MGAPATRALPAAILATLALAACSPSKGTKSNDSEKPPTITVFATTEIKGQIEPCGCTSDPLGDLARTAELIEAARAGSAPVLYLDGGSMLYPDIKIPENQRPQEKLKAGLLQKVMGKDLRIDGAGLGPYDLSMGPGLALPRHAANLPAGSAIPTAAPELKKLGGIAVGVFGVVSPEALSAFDIKPSDPVAASAAAVKKLRAGGAQVVIGLLHMTRAEATALVREVPGIDFAIIGRNAPRNADMVRPEPVRAGSTWLIQPGDRGQVVSRLDIAVRDPEKGFSDAIGEARAKVEIDSLDESIAGLEKKLAKWKADPNADKQFVATKERELAADRARRAELTRSPLVVPEQGSWFTLAQIEIDRALACDAEVVSAKKKYDRAAGQANLAAADQIEPPQPAAGQASYVGVKECATCHKKAVAMWKTTKHFKAWETLVARGKQFHLDCIGCHVTGWAEPGGANLAFNEKLRDVQCEVCHGPGSLHVAADGEGHIVRTPEKSRCIKCHSEEHSDTFDFKPYLRDVTGPGHGEAFRQSLGDGVTGHELRSEALRKAGLKIGKGCPK